MANPQAKDISRLQEVMKFGRGDLTPRQAYSMGQRIVADVVTSLVTHDFLHDIGEDRIILIPGVGDRPDALQTTGLATGSIYHELVDDPLNARYYVGRNRANEVPFAVGFACAYDPSTVTVHDAGRLLVAADTAIGLLDEANLAFTDNMTLRALGGALS